MPKGVGVQVPLRVHGSAFIILLKNKAFTASKLIDLLVIRVIYVMPFKAQ